MDSQSLVLSVLLSACSTSKNEQTVGFIKETESIKVVEKKVAEKNDLTEKLSKEVPQKIEVSSVNPFTNAKIEVAKVIKYPTDKQQASIMNPSAIDSSGFYAANTLFTVDGEDVPTVNSTDVDQYLQQFVDTDLYQKITFAMFYYEDNSSAVYLKTGDTSLLIDGTRNIMDASLATGKIKICNETNPGPCLNDYKKNGEAKDTTAPMSEFPFIQNLSTTQKITKIIVSFGGKAKIEDNTTSGKKTLTEHISVVDNSNEQFPAPITSEQASVINMEDLGFKTIASNVDNNNFSASLVNLQMPGIDPASNVTVNSSCKITNTNKYNFPIFELCLDANTNKGVIEIDSNASEWFYYFSNNNQAGGREAQEIKFTPGVYSIDMDHWESLSLLGTMYIKNGTDRAKSMVRFTFASHKLNTSIGYHYDATYRYRDEQDKQMAKEKLSSDKWQLCMALSDTNALNGVPFEGLNTTTMPLPDTLFIPTGTVFRGDECTFINWSEFETNWAMNQNVFNTPIAFQAYQSTIPESVNYKGKDIGINSLAYIRMGSDKWKQEKDNIKLEVCKLSDDNQCIKDGTGNTYNFLSEADFTRDKYGYSITVPNLTKLIEEKDSNFIGLENGLIVVKLVFKDLIYDASVMLIERTALPNGVNMSTYVKDLEKSIKLNGFLENEHFYNSRYKKTLDPSIMGKTPFGFQFAGDIILKENGVEIGRTTIDPETYNRFDNPTLNALMNNMKFYPLFDPIYFDFGMLEIKNGDTKTLSISLEGSENWGFKDCKANLPEFPVHSIVEENGITTLIVGHHVIITFPDNNDAHCRLDNVVKGVNNVGGDLNWLLGDLSCDDHQCSYNYNENQDSYYKRVAKYHNMPNIKDFVFLRSDSKNMENVHVNDCAGYIDTNDQGNPIDKLYSNRCMVLSGETSYFKYNSWKTDESLSFVQLVYIDRPMDRIAWMSPVIYAPGRIGLYPWYESSFALSAANRSEYLKSPQTKIDCTICSGIGKECSSYKSNLDYMNENGILYSLSPAPLWSEPKPSGKIYSKNEAKYWVNYYGDKTREYSGWGVNDDPEKENIFMGPFAEWYAKIDPTLKANLKTAKDKFIAQNPVEEEEDPVNPDNSNTEDYSVKIPFSVKDCLFTIKTSDETTIDKSIGDLLGFKLDFKGVGGMSSCFDYVQNAENYGLIVKVYQTNGAEYNTGTIARDNEFTMPRDNNLDGKKLCIEFTDKKSKIPSRNCIKLSYENNKFTSVPVSYSVIAPIDKEVIVEAVTSENPYQYKDRYFFEANGSVRSNENPIYSSVISVPEENYRLITVEYDNTATSVAFNYGDWSHNKVLTLADAKGKIYEKGRVVSFVKQKIKWDKRGVKNCVDICSKSECKDNSFITYDNKTGQAIQCNESLEYNISDDPKLNPGAYYYMIWSGNEDGSNGIYGGDGYKGSFVKSSAFVD